MRWPFNPFIASLHARIRTHRAHTDASHHVIDDMERICGARACAYRGRRAVKAYFRLSERLLERWFG